MKTIAALALGLGMLASARAEDKDAPKLEGKYTLVAGKKNGAAVDEEAKKAEYTITADKITIKGKDITFVMGYKIDAKATPAAVDMVILDGPAPTKGAKALGIVEVKGDTLKLAYAVAKDKDGKAKRPENFEGKDGFLFELKKAK